MVRLILHMLKIRDYESCKSCETLRQQLDYANAEKKALFETLINLTKPTTQIPQPDVKILGHIPNSAGTFSRRRSILEQAERKGREIRATSPFVAEIPGDKTPTNIITPQSVEALERELGVVDETGEQANAS